VAAEQAVAVLASEPVVSERLLAAQEAESIRLDDHAPGTGLGADRAVALARALGEIDIGFEADGAAMAVAA
jgi:hypothetical protein